MMRSTAAQPAPLAHKNGAPHANGAERADREAELLPVARQLRARYRRSLCCLTVRGIAVALMRLADQGRLDFEALRADLDNRDMREITRLLSGDTRLQMSLRGAGSA
jgi:hypothetical protein